MYDLDALQVTLTSIKHTHINMMINNIIFLKEKTMYFNQLKVLSWTIMKLRIRV